jgi:hypothetical protein
MASEKVPRQLVLPAKLGFEELREFETPVAVQQM